MPITSKAITKVAVLYSGGSSLSGIEKYLIHLFSSVNDPSINIELLSLGEWPLTEKMQALGLPVKVFNSGRIRFKTVAEIGEYCVQNRINLLVSQGTVSNAYARLVSKRYNVPNLVTVHSEPKGDYKSPLIRGIYWLFDRKLRHSTVKYIAVSKFLAEYLVRSGIPKSQISVVYNGSDYPKPAPRQHKRLVIGSLGRLHFVKGYDLLIRAFALLENKRLRLKLAGVGDELENLKKLAVELGVSDRVEFVGYKSDVFEFLKSIDIYAQPSRSEGFGVALVEAMSQNLPVVVTPAGAMTEIVTDSETGYISKDLSPEAIADALSKAFDIKTSTEVGENAGKFVNKNFCTKVWVDNTIKAYKEAAK